MLRRKWILFSSLGTTVVFVISGFRNYSLYKEKPAWWITLKSLFDGLIVLFLAFKLPRLLIAWVSLWLTKPIKRPGVRITAGVLLGLGLDMMAGGFLEILILLSLFAVDLVTGKAGFLGYYREYKDKELQPVS